MAQACEIEACDGATPLSAWISALGGVGSALGDGDASTLTYNVGGTAAGLDYRVDPRVVVGLGVAYTTGTQWVNNFQGRGWSDGVSLAAYGSFTQGGFYADALAGYAYFNNQLQRQMTIPGLTNRMASGSTGANQFMGQVETGYKIEIYAPAAASITPFGRLQASTVTQNAFSEWGASSLSLNVAQQATNSLRTTFGADLAGGVDLGGGHRVDLGAPAGLLHEYASTARPHHARPSPAPRAIPSLCSAPRRGGMRPWSASPLPPPWPSVPSLYMRYDGDLGGGTDNHAINLGIRITW